jgi:hypothetical protein
LSITLHAGQYFQDFAGIRVGSISFGDGSQLFGTGKGSATGAVLTNYIQTLSLPDGSLNNTNLELQLTESNAENITSAFELPALDPTTPVYAFSVKWNADVNGNFDNAADGFSFNYGQLSSLNLLTDEVGAGIESGYSTGLCFSVQNYVDGNPGFYIRANGTNMASSTFDPATE